jgi:hypothetical protein
VISSKEADHDHAARTLARITTRPAAAARPPSAVVMRILGPITARLLKQHGPDSPAWHPGRPADVPQPVKGKKLPKGVDGAALGRGGRRTYR